MVLVRARGQALYRDILYERVWGPDAEPNPRALDLHIHRLRKKLDWADKIMTVPKVGISCWQNGRGRACPPAGCKTADREWVMAEGCRAGHVRPTWR